MQILKTDTFITFLNLTYPSWRREVPESVVRAIDSVVSLAGNDYCFIASDLQDAVLTALEDRFGKNEEFDGSYTIWWSRTSKFVHCAWIGVEDGVPSDDYEVLIIESLEDAVKNRKKYPASWDSINRALQSLAEALETPAKLDPK